MIENLPPELVACIIEFVLHDPDATLEIAGQLATVCKQWRALLHFDAPLRKLCHAHYAALLDEWTICEPHACRALGNEKPGCCDTLEYTFFVASRVLFAPRRRSSLQIVSIQYESPACYGYSALQKHGGFESRVRIVLVRGPFDSTTLVDAASVGDDSVEVVCGTTIAADRSTERGGKTGSSNNDEDETDERCRLQVGSTLAIWVTPRRTLHSLVVRIQVRALPNNDAS